MDSRLSRRTVLGGLALAVGAPACVRAEGSIPHATSGVQSGDVRAGRAVVWSRCDRAARMLVEWDTSERFVDPRRLTPVAALEDRDFTARIDLRDLPAGETICYRLRFQDLADLRSLGPWHTGKLTTPPATKRDLTFVWSGDTAGQGWGIDTAGSGSGGGMLTYRSMHALRPDFFLHSGDTIYADNPLQAEVKLDDGTLWRNLVTPEKSKVAETLDEFRGNHRYNLLDPNVRDFLAETPALYQWDDHETRNNWFPGQILDDPRYRVRSVDLLAARARRAFLDYTPIRANPTDPDRVFRSYRQGPLLEVFLLDERSYRGPNTSNRQATRSGETDFLGTPQLEWLKRRLLASKAVWKVIASDMPLGLVVGDGTDRYEAWANGAGPPAGRELELAELLRHIRDRRIRNTVWLTADVHYAAAHEYHPTRATFTEFSPFWEFVAGPLHAGNFGPGTLDPTFGPRVDFHSVRPGTRPNRPPSEGHQYFGHVRIDGRSAAMTVSLHNRVGERVYRRELAPEASR